MLILETNELTSNLKNWNLRLVSHLKTFFATKYKLVAAVMSNISHFIKHKCLFNIHLYLFCIN